MNAKWQYIGSPSGPAGSGGPAQVLAVHAALLPAGESGRIVYFSGSQWVEPNIWEAIENEAQPRKDARYPAGKAQIDHCRVYDCATLQVSNPGCPDADLFCSGHALLGDGSLLIAGGTQHFPEAGTADLHHAHWSGSRETFIFSPFAEVRAGIGAEITAVWAPRQPEHLDLFMAGPDGTVWSTWWEAAQGWQPWFCIHSEIKAFPGTKITALWAPRQPRHLDLFMTGTDGAVWSTWWEAAQGWQPWFLIHPEIKMHPKAAVTALWRDQHLDLFATGTDGAVWSAWWETSGGWRPWFLIHPEIKAAVGAAVSAAWAPRQAGHLDLFMTGTDGAVWSTWWEAAPGWQKWFLIHPEIKMHAGAAVTALWRDQHLDLFATGTDGAVWSAWWEASGGWRPWFLVHPEIKAAVGATVSAAWAPRESGHLDLFMTGTDGAVWSAWWEAAPGWQKWFLIHPEVKMHAGAAVTALWRDQHLDLFTTGTDGAVWSAWWEASGAWRPWFPILAAGPWSGAGLLNRDPAQTQAGGPMGGGRWYPTLITLASGKVMALTGHPLISNFTGSLLDFDVRHNNTKPELFDPATRQWSLINKALGVDQAHDYAPYYPRLHLVPHTGEVLVVQPLYSKLVVDYDPASPQCRQPAAGQDLCSVNPLDTHPPYSVDVMDKSLFYDVNAANVTRAFPGPQNADQLYLDRFFTSQETTSVMLPLLHEENYHPRVMICGAAQPLIADLDPGTTLIEWKPTAPRTLAGHPQRNFATAILLPTGDVLVSGGVTSGKYTEADGVRAAEIYHPPLMGAPDSWEEGPVAGETRGYHSVALLTPDGRVWTAGSEWNDTATPNLSIELFEPDYYLNPNRLAVTTAPRNLARGSSFTVQFTAGFTVRRVALMRLGSATHAFDGDQRYVGIPFTQSGAALTAQVPADSTIVPPGYYMLWLIDSNNLPCKLAPFVNI